MQERKQWKLFDIDSMLEEAGTPDLPGETIDLWVSALAYKNFDFVEKRRPFLVECRTYNPDTWQRIIEVASKRYWIVDAGEGVVVFDPTNHCGCVRTYRFGCANPSTSVHRKWEWCRISSEDSLYSMLDTPGARGIFDAWHKWTTQQTQKATDLADGRRRNTEARRSLIFASTTGCAVCSSGAIGYANTTVGFAGETATLIQLPLCATHLELAHTEPNVLTYLSKIFCLPVGLTPSSVDAIPDALIPMVHEFVASELQGSIGETARRTNGWHLTINLDNEWCWRLRLRSLSDYAYMLFKNGEVKAIYRADSAQHHPELDFFPHHEHLRPDSKKAVVQTSYLYGMPIFDLKRLRDISIEVRANGKLGGELASSE